MDEQSFTKKIHKRISHRSYRVIGEADMPRQLYRGMPNRLIESIISYCKKHKLIKPNSSIIIGLSGGPDSVCLTSILTKLAAPYQLKLIAVHIDHEWRSTSADDARFCQEFAASLSLPFHCIKASEIILEKKYNGSKEERGRHLRRQALEEIARTYSADTIALGHHADDQQETFFLRMIRGASIAGLSSMRPKEMPPLTPTDSPSESYRRAAYIRPLLESHKAEILAYLAQEKLSYVVDSTNESEAYLRNALRLKVLPALKATDDRFDNNFFKTLNHIQETEKYLERQTDKLFAELTSLDKEALWLDYEKLLSTDPFMHHPILMKWLVTMGVPFTPSTGFLNEIVRFLKNKSKKHVLNTDWLVEKKAHRVSIRSVNFS